MAEQVLMYFDHRFKHVKTAAQQQFFLKMQHACPNIPTEEHTDGSKKFTVLAPAQTYLPERHNYENPETYSIWPARILQVKCENSNKDFRWPATWGPNYDYMPDQNHGGNLLNTAQLMLLQSDGKKILLFPAWPADWDVDFKLHAAFNTTVEATLKNGKLIRLKVMPSARAKDMVNYLDYLGKGRP